jgi:serpin B
MYGVHYASSVDGFKVLKLPYKHGRDDAAGVASPGADDTQYSMYLFLPDERQGIANMVDAITTGPDYMYNVLTKTAPETVKVTLPKFEISFRRELVLDLPKLGLSLPFSPESADLQGIFKKGQQTFLSRLLHKAVVKVDEDGTEAAAVTMGMMQVTAMQPELPVEFVADHPFSFFIMEERSGVIVFAGHVLDPTKRSAS